MKKKLIAILLTMAMLIGIVPTALAAGETTASAAPEAIKVLTIGEDFSRASMTNYLHEVLTAEGYTDITLGHLYASSHYTLGDYVKDYENKKGPDDPTIYVLELNRVNYWDYVYRYTLDMTLEEADWDYVVLQTSPIASTDADRFAKDVEAMAAIVKAKLPNAKIGVHMNWAFQKGYENSSSEFRYLYKFGWFFSQETANKTLGAWIKDAKANEQKDRDQFKAQFNADPNTMFEAVAKAARQAAGKVDFVVPAGTALMNAETSFMGDLRADEGEPVVDGANLNETGKLVTSYLWYSAITGNKVDSVKYSQDFLFDLSSAERKAVAEAVNNAVKNPYKITESSYKTEPAQYNVTVNGTTQKCLPGDVMSITAQAMRGADRMFLNWSVEKGSVKLGDAKSLTTTFTVPAEDVEIKAVYTAAEDAGQLMVGFGRGDVTPFEGINLDGYGDFANRPTRGPRTPEDLLQGNAIAISDGETTHILISLDQTTTDTTWLNWLRERVEKETGLPGSAITVSSTHSHAAPSYGEKQPVYRQAVQHTKEKTPEYYNLWMDGMTKACKDALADLKPVAETKVKSISVPGMNWQRHWRYTGGVMSGINFSASGGRYKGVTRDADQELQFIRFVRDNAKDILLVNWQGHNHILSSTNTTEEDKDIYYRSSADVAGALYRYLEEMDDDCYAIVFFGASANLHMIFTGDYALQWRWTFLSRDPETYAAKLGDYILANMDRMTTVETGKVQHLTQIHKGLYNRDGYVTRDVEQEVITIGDTIAFAGASYEMVDSSGMDVKNGSPFDTTFILSNTGSNHYMGTWQIGHYPLLGGAEAYEARSASLHFILGTAEDLVDGLVALLNILYKK